MGLPPQHFSAPFKKSPSDNTNLLRQLVIFVESWPTGKDSKS
jgi:hypothetical protein